jgi:pimeloyl-ACP methyl ester carboxylesterase
MSASTTPTTDSTILGVRLIALDRPGIGCSDLKPGYRLLAWPADVVEAVSGGGAYDLACAYTIPHRLTACGLICSIAPGQLITKDAPLWMRAMWWMGGHLPWLYRLFVRLLMAAPGSDAVRIERQLARSSRFFEESDRKVLQNAEARRLIAQALAEYI